MKLEPDLRDAFMAVARASHRPASQVMRELMRDFVQRQQERVDYRAFLELKVDTARVSVHKGRGHSNEAAEAGFAARRARINGRA